MYLFRQFWAFLWIADFFQKSIVSRGSVNADPEKGPRLPQSFSTEVAIESGLYIAPGIQVSRVWTTFSGPDTCCAPNLHFRDFVRKVAKVPSWLETCWKCTFGKKCTFRTFGVQTRETRETCESWIRSLRPWSAHDSSQTRQVATLCGKSRQDMSGWNHMWTCSAQVRDSRCDMCARSAHMCTTDSCNPAESCLHVHVRYMHGTCTQFIRVKGKLTNRVHLATFVSFLNIVRFENNFWNK